MLSLCTAAASYAQHATSAHVTDSNVTVAATTFCRYNFIYSDGQLDLKEHLDALMTASAFINSSSNSSSTNTAPTRAVRAKLTCMKALVSDLQQVQNSR
jgi:hypothetical protein